MARSIKKGPFVDPHLMKKGGGGPKDKGSKGDQNLVETIHHCP